MQLQHNSTEWNLTSNYEHKKLIQKKYKKTLNENFRHAIPKVAWHCFHLTPSWMIAPQEEEAFFLVNRDHVSLLPVQTVTCPLTHTQLNTYSI